MWAVARGSVWERVARDRQNEQTRLLDHIAHLERDRVDLLEQVSAATKESASASALATRENEASRHNADQAAKLNAQLATIEATRAWRVARRYWRLRARLQRQPRGFAADDADEPADIQVPGT